MLHKDEEQVEEEEVGIEEEKTLRRQKLRKKREKQEDKEDGIVSKRVGRLKPFNPNTRRISWKDLDNE